MYTTDLGHPDVTHTYWYFSADPELLPNKLQWPSPYDNTQVHYDPRGSAKNCSCPKGTLGFLEGPAEERKKAA
jgi:hypothetical protein